MRSQFAIWCGGVLGYVTVVKRLSMYAAIVLPLVLFLLAGIRRWRKKPS